jgi:hypothetical protein
LMSLFITHGCPVSLDSLHEFALLPVSFGRLAGSGALRVNGNLDESGSVAP